MHDMVTQSIASDAGGNMSGKSVYRFASSLDLDSESFDPSKPLISISDWVI